MDGFSFVTQVCVSGHPATCAKLEGADTVLRNCRGPLEDEFVIIASDTGDAVAKGKDSPHSLQPHPFRQLRVLNL